MTSLPIDWHHAAPAPVALLIMPRVDGVTLLHRDASGALFGCRDINRKPGSEAEFFACLAAWIKDARRRQNLRIEDRANACAAIRAYARRMVGCVKGVG